jgi:hypothetical protein
MKDSKYSCFDWNDQNGNQIGIGSSHTTAHHMCYWPNCYRNNKVCKYIIIMLLWFWGIWFSRTQTVRQLNVEGRKYLVSFIGLKIETLSWNGCLTYTTQPPTSCASTQRQSLWVLLYSTFSNTTARLIISATPPHLLNIVACKYSIIERWLSWYGLL